MSWLKISIQLTGGGDRQAGDSDADEEIGGEDVISVSNGSSESPIPSSCEVDAHINEVTRYCVAFRCRTLFLLTRVERRVY